MWNGGINDVENLVISPLLVKLLDDATWYINNLDYSLALVMTRFDFEVAFFVIAVFIQLSMLDQLKYHVIIVVF